MHYHMEIVMPPTHDVETSIAQIMGPFSESGEDEDGNRNSHAFWDWYVVGGRWAGAKLEAKIGDLEPFYAALKERNVTISRLIWGKQEISPASQIPMVDALWREMYPGSWIEVCPMFKHAPGVIAGDICALKDMPITLTASHVIIAGEGYGDEKKLEAKYMIQDSIWNGVTHVDTQWDKNVATAVTEHAEKLKRCRDEYREKNTPKPDWLVVTIDYHS